jgi:hypothetical protein
MYIKLTNASLAHKGHPVILKISEIVTVFTSTVTRENDLTGEVTMVYCPPHGTWEVEESADTVYEMLTQLTKNS